MATKLPMFPLGTVVFPFTAIPLRVFEPRYQTLVDWVLEDQEERSFGTVLIERGFEVGGGDVRFDQGTRLQLSGVADLEEGHRAIVVTGVERIKVTRWIDDDPHPWAEVEAWPDEDQPVTTEVEIAHTRLRRVMALASELGADTAELDLEVADEPLVASYQISALSPLTSLDAQRLLTAPGPADRLEMVSAMLDEQIQLIQAQLGSG